MVLSWSSDDADERINVCFLRFIFFSLFELRRNRATYLQVFLFLTGTQTFQRFLLLGQFEVKHGWAEGVRTRWHRRHCVGEVLMHSPQGMQSPDLFRRTALNVRSD